LINYVKFTIEKIPIIINDVNEINKEIKLLNLEYFGINRLFY